MAENTMNSGARNWPTYREVRRSLWVGIQSVSVCSRREGEEEEGQDTTGRKVMQAAEATEELGSKPGVTQGALKNDASIMKSN